MSESAVAFSSALPSSSALPFSSALIVCPRRSHLPDVALNRRPSSGGRSLRPTAAASPAPADVLCHHPLCRSPPPPPPSTCSRDNPNMKLTGRYHMSVTGPSSPFTYGVHETNKFSAATTVILFPVRELRLEVARVYPLPATNTVMPPSRAQGLTSEPSTAYWMADLISAYGRMASFKPGIRFLNGRRQVLSPRTGTLPLDGPRRAFTMTRSSLPNQVDLPNAATPTAAYWNRSSSRSSTTHLPSVDNAPGSHHPLRIRSVAVMNPSMEPVREARLHVSTQGTTHKMTDIQLQRLRSLKGGARKGGGRKMAGPKQEE
ncbi:hypothetical protein ACG7TL_002585 [Trametes sanguinea]